MSTKTKVADAVSKTFENQNASKAIIAKVDVLVTKREHFEQNEYKRSNAALNLLLDETYTHYLEASKERGVLIETVKAMKPVLEQAGIKVQKNTLTLGVFVRYVFRTDRQRAYNYTNVIKAAIQEGVEAGKLVEFIEANGGIEEIKKKTVLSAKQESKQASVNAIMPTVDDLMDNVEQDALAEFHVPPEMVMAAGEGDVAIMLGKTDGTGRVQVAFMVPAHSKQVEQWCKAKMAEYLVAQAEAAEAAAKKAAEEAAASAKAAENENSPASETLGELLSTEE